MKNVIKNIIVVIVRLLKRLILKLDNLEKRASCENYVTNNGAFFFPESNITNFKKNKKFITVGSGTYIRGQLLVYPYGGQINVGDNCYIGEGTRIWSGEGIFIGNNVLISHNVNIMDTDSHEIDASERSASYKSMIQNGHPFEKGSIKTSPIIINDDVWINFNVSILKGVKIGKGVIIAAGSVVTKDIPPFVMVGGIPAKVLKTLDCKIND